MTQSDYIALLFPGQGSQKPGMGLPFVDSKEFEIASNAADILGIDTKRLLCDDSSDSLNNTHDAQLSILLTSLMSYERFKDRNETPICFAGHSLGQVSALICAGVLSFQEGINFASKRAIATQNCADKYGGAMAALLGADMASTKMLCENYPELWIANDNAPGQIVIAGNQESIQKAIDNARDYEIKKAVLLPVNGAFHTPYMDDAVSELQEVLKTMTFSKPICGVASNDDGRAYTTADVWQEKLSIHVARTVRWVDCMDAVKLLEPLQAYEIGFGNTLSGLAKRCTPNLKVESFYTGDENG